MRKKECTFCKKLIKHSNGLRSHINICSSRPKNSTQEKKPKVQRTNAAEKAEEANKSYRVCKICNSRFKSKSGFNKHKQTHTGGFGDSIDVINVLKDMPGGTNFVISEDATAMIELVAEAESDMNVCPELCRW